MRQKVSKIFFLVCLSLIIVFDSLAQISFGGIPKSTTKTRFAAENSIPCISVACDSLIVDCGFVEKKIPCAKSFAKAISVDIDLKKNALKTYITDELVQYSLMIKSSGAVSLNFIFSEFDLPDGARLFLSTPDKSEILGAYTNKSLLPSFHFATTPIECDTVLLIYEEPIAEDGKLKISQVNRGFYSLRKLPQFARSEECEINAECEPDSFENIRRATCIYVINGTLYCSGTLLNNTGDDGTPYLLTSAHCLFDAANRVDTSLAKSLVFFFDYKSPLCLSQIEGTREKSIVGATVSAYDNKKDALLLKLSQIPPVDYMPYFSPWDATGESEGSSICFHHPSGDVMKASYDADELRDTTFAPLIFDRACHFKVNTWERGITESGSSGAALYNHGMVVGALSGGAKDISCENPSFDCFWKLSKVWDSFSQFLSPKDTLNRICQGFQPYTNPCRVISNYNKESLISEGYVDEYGYNAGTNAEGITQVAEKFELGGKAKIYGVSFFPVVATYNAEEPIIMSVLDAEMNALWSSEVRVKNTEYIKKSQTITEKDVLTLSYKENYIRLPEPIEVDGSVYVAFDFSNCSQKFALFNVADKDKEPSAFYKKSDKWQKYDSEILNSLMVNLTAQTFTENRLETNTDNNIVIFPNPSSGKFSILFPENRSGMVTVINSLGKIVWIENIENKNILEISAQFPSGVYALEFAQERGVERKKIIIR